jgi:hypothetical protein
MKTPATLINSEMVNPETLKSIGQVTHFPFLIKNGKVYTGRIDEESLKSFCDGGDVSTGAEAAVTEDTASEEGPQTPDEELNMVFR